MHTMLRVLICMIIVLSPVQAQNLVTYAGSVNKERFNDVHVLSDGTILVAGAANDLDWISATVPRTTLTTAISSASTGNVGFILHLSADQTSILRVVSFPIGSVRDVYKIRSTEVPGSTTGQLYISGNRDGGSSDGYYIAKLNNNFVAGAPTAIIWSYDVSAAGELKDKQPWDVDGDGKVIFAVGEVIATNWLALYRLNASGVRDIVPNFRTHWRTDDSEWDGTPASSYSGALPLAYSGLALKASRRGGLRSATQAEFDILQNDANGNPNRKGAFPDDYYFSGPCPLDGSVACDSSGPGYTGYRISAIKTQRVVDIAIDRRNNHFYFGYGTQSRLPNGNPDFEPAVVAMDHTGLLKWWDRIYQETTSSSSPDQYVDAIAIDYAQNRVVVLARSHGNNTFNLWPANQLTYSPSTNGFQNRFTGTNGNAHYSWLGKYGLDDGKIYRVSWIGEYFEPASGLGSAHPDPNLDGWANPNAGNPQLNDTKCRSEIAVRADGAVAVTCKGRRTITTVTAFQKMPKPGVSTSAWNSFVRVYSPNLDTLLYSTLMVGAFDNSGVGGDNIQTTGIALTANGVLATGYHLTTTDVSGNPTNTPDGNTAPTINVPGWGNAAPNNESAMLGRYALPSAATDNLFKNGFE
jgi:hypothetical protein